jgi:hypothetical protein
MPGSQVQILRIPDQEVAIKFKLTPEWIAQLKELQKRREALGEKCNWRPLWENINEVALVYYLQKENRSLTAKLLGLSEMTLLRLNNAVEKEHKASVFDSQHNTVVKIDVEPEKLLQMIQQPSEDVEKLLEQYEKLKEKQILTKFMVIREFLKNPVRVEQRSKEQFYSPTQVRDTLNKLAELLIYLRNNKSRFNAPLNPDIWTKEHENILALAIESLCIEKGYTTEVRKRSCKAMFMGAIRRIKRFYDMGLFQGMLGRVTSRIIPRTEFMNLDQYKTLYKKYVETDDNEYKAWFEIMTLHLLTGAREGYGSVVNKIRMDMWKAGIEEGSVESIDLDEEEVESSLIGIKWDNVVFTQDYNDIVIRIYERKTGETWTLASCWLGDWYVKILRERYEYARSNNIKSVVKTILLYYGINKTTIYTFKQFYTTRTAEYTQNLIGVRLNPHRIRASHISILYELGIPLELVVHKSGNFGVGWSDLTTAIEFYWRITSKKVKEYMEKAKETSIKVLQE